MSWSRVQTRASGSVLQSEQLYVVSNWIWERMQDLWPSQHKNERESTVINETSTLWFLFFLIVGRHESFCGDTATSAFNFWHRSRFFKINCSGPLTWMHHRMCMMDSSYSPLVCHLLTSWQPAWQLSLYYPLILSSGGEIQTCAIVCNR